MSETARGKGRARRGRDPRRRTRHRGGARRGRRDGVRDRAQHARAALRDRPARDDRGDRRARDRGGRRGHRRSRSTTSTRRRSAALVERIDSEHGRLDVLVNDIWGAEHLFELDTPLWEHDLDNGLRLLRLAIDTHLITSHHALPLLIRSPGGLVVEVTDGTADYNADHYRVNAVLRPREDVGRSGIGVGARRRSSRPHGGTAVALTPGWMRSELMLEHHGVSESNWRDATERAPHFCISESPRFVGRAVAALAGDPDVRAGTGSRCRAAGSRRSTASPTSTARARTAGATWSRWSRSGRAAGRRRATAESRPTDSVAVSRDIRGKLERVALRSGPAASQQR